jgi:hypothetical protein
MNILYNDTTDHLMYEVKSMYYGFGSIEEHGDPLEPHEFSGEHWYDPYPPEELSELVLGDYRKITPQEVLELQGL